MAMVVGMAALPGFSTKALAAEYPDYLSFTAVDGDVTIGMNKTGTPDDYVLEYSKDRQNWTSVTLTDTNESIVMIPRGETYYFRTDRVRDGLGNGVTYDEDLEYDVYYYWNFLMTGEGKVKAGGNVMSLLDPTCEKTSVGEYAFLHLFAFCNKLLTAPTLPAQTLADHCYEYMFRWCWSLTEAPELPAQELAPYCYSFMFDECGLRTTPELPALILAEHCYLEMFMNCWSLTTAFDLPATDLEEGCYAGMFAWCRNLTEAPELPAQTLIPGCYSGMFRDCTKLSSVTVGFTGVEADYTLDYCLVDWLEGVSETGTLYCPKSTMQYTNEELGLPAGWVKKDTNENDYLSFTAVDGDVTIGMNKNATPDDYVLEYSKNCLAWTSVTLTDTTEDIVTIPDGETYYFRTDRERDGIGKMPGYDDNGCWVYGQWNFLMTGDGNVEAGGNIMSLLDPTCEKTRVGIYAFEALFFECDKLLTAPKLPAQTLSTFCYHSMFSGCSSLTEAPELPAQTLALYCYDCMFRNCSSLTKAPELPAQTLIYYCYRSMFEGCTELSSVSVGFTEVAAYDTITGCLENWLEGVSETGTLLCPESTMQYSNEELCLPAGWVKQDVKEQTRQQINSFVTRMYEQCLSRDPDEAGRAGWAEQLETGQMNGAQIAEAFVFSNEMLDKNLSDAEFVKVLYRSMMGREADEAGLAGWVSQLQGGFISRSEVTKAFVESAEFTGICSEYEIARGDFAAVGDIERFVTRFYTICLGRPADQKGHWGWVKQLQNKNLNGAQIAEAFFFSEEFVGKNVSDEVYIATLYRTILGREADEAGLTGWVEQLQNNQMTRRDILAAFIESAEFTGLCAGYHIERGSL